MHSRKKNYWNAMHFRNDLMEFFFSLVNSKTLYNSPFQWNWTLALFEWSTWNVLYWVNRKKKKWNLYGVAKRTHISGRLLNACHCEESSTLKWKMHFNARLCVQFDAFFLILVLNFLFVVSVSLLASWWS